MAQERSQHSLLAKSLHWFFVLLFGYGVLKQIENKEQLNDLELLKSEIFFALIFLIFILFRFIFMKRGYKTALSSNSPKIQLIAAKFVRIASGFQSEIMIHLGNREVSGKSIMGIMMLAAGKGKSQS